MKKRCRGKKSKKSGENDHENNCSEEEGLENAEVQKHPLSILMHMKLSKNMEEPVGKPNPLEEKAARSDLVADDGPTSTQLDISNIKLPSSIDAQMKLLSSRSRSPSGGGRSSMSPQGKRSRSRSRSPSVGVRRSASPPARRSRSRRSR